MGDISTDIQSLADKYARALGELHDDYVHTRQIWRYLQVRVQYYGEKLTVENPVTGTNVDGADLAAKAPASVERLNNRCFKDLVAQFELFVSELLRLWLPVHHNLVHEKAINVATLLSSKTLAEAQEAAIDEAVESTITDRMYGQPKKWLDYLKRKLRVQFDSRDELSYTEMKARRDVLEHNNGIVETTYLKKADSLARYQLGEKVQLTESDVNEVYLLVLKLINRAAMDAKNRDAAS